MRFNIKEMKYQGIFLGILAGVLAIVILVSYLTSLGPAVPTVDETPENAETQTESAENKTDKVTNKNDKDTNNNTNKNDKGNNNSTTDKKDETQTEVEHVHKWVKGSTVNPTCTEGGYTINTCGCGESKTTDEKAALGHKLGEWKTAPADSDGVVYNVRSCSRCDYNEKQKVEEHIHKWVKGSTVNPTCTEGGYTINTCECGENKNTDEKAALGHKLGEWTLTEPDEKGDVYSVRSCSACDYNEKQKVETSGEEESPEQDGENQE